MSTTLDETDVSVSRVDAAPAHHKVNLGALGAYWGFIFGMVGGAVATGALVAVLAIAGSWYDSLLDVFAISSVFVVVGGFFGALLGLVVGFFVSLLGVERAGLMGGAFERKVFTEVSRAAKAAPVRRMYDDDERLPFEGCALGSFVGAAAGLAVLAAFVLAMLGGMVVPGSDSAGTGVDIVVITLPVFLFIGSIVAAVAGGAIGAIGGFLLGLTRWESQAKWVGSALGTAPLWPFLGSADLGISSGMFGVAAVAFVLGAIGLGAGLLFEHRFQHE